MERKHQVFVSSTYKDLVEERKEVIHALLELDCIPAGMELFPAADEDAWSLIKEVIDGCDYYLLILGGKYGSLNSDGVGYTEMEFDYAASQGKPMICFLHENIDNLAASKVESTDAAKEKLQLFRDKASSKHCKFWSSAPDLGGKISRSLIQLKKKHPSDGWVPGKYAADQKMLSEIERLRAKIAELEADLTVASAKLGQDIENLEQGDDLLKMEVLLKKTKSGKAEKVILATTWDKLFAYCGPELVGECSDSKMLEKMQLAFWHSVPENIRDFNIYTDIVIPYVYEDAIKVQFRALGLMEHGVKKRAVSDTNNYWKLTSYGDMYLIKVSARRRSAANE